MSQTAESPAAVILRYFAAQPHGRKVTLAEFKTLTLDDRCELAELIEREAA